LKDKVRQVGTKERVVRELGLLAGSR